MSGSGKSSKDKVKQNKGLGHDRVARRGLLRRQQLSRIREESCRPRMLGARALRREPLWQGVGKAGCSGWSKVWVWREAGSEVRQMAGSKMM